MTKNTATHESKNMKTFFIIWGGQLVSIIGSSLTAFALGVWIYAQTGDAMPFAMTMLFATLPGLLLAPVAGALADRYDRRMLMILGDTGDALVTGVAALLLFSGELQIWHIYLIAFVSSAFSAFQQPAYEASVTMLVPKKQLARASGMVQMGGAISALLTPILAGVLYDVVGIKWIMVIDFVTYFFAIGALFFVRIPMPKRVTDTGGDGQSSLWHDIRFGWNYLVQRKGLFWLLWYFAMINFLLSSTAVLAAPLILSFGTPTDLGMMQMVAGATMLVGSILMSAWGGPKRRKVWAVIGFIALSGIGMAVTGLRPNLWTIGLGRFLFLFFIPFAAAISQSVWQTKIAPDVQGRVFSIRRFIASSMSPIAFPIAGILHDKVFGPMMVEGGKLADGVLGRIFGVGDGRGAGLIFVLGGALMWVASGIIFLNPHVRNVETELADIEIIVAGETGDEGLPEGVPEAA